MYISQETTTQTDLRLKEVIRTATFRWFPQAYYFKEVPLTEFSFEREALAMVRDEDVWSYLIPAATDQTENFQLFSFHFQEGLDNSGFVGWLAGKIKAELGAGVFVVCGQNTAKGGIFDYWGCPVQLAGEIEKFIGELRTLTCSH